jgi:uncharacterized Zn-finger protein
LKQTKLGHLHAVKLEQYPDLHHISRHSDRQFADVSRVQEQGISGVDVQPLFMPVILEDPVVTHHGRQEDFQCMTCERSYRYKKNMMRHIRFECGKEPQFQCPYCPKKSKLKSNLKQHIILKHEGPIARM